MPNRTLQHHLHPPSRNQTPRLDWGTRLRIALDCARALEFLHEYTIPSVIHRDFKCSNVLLDRNFRAKVSDFGLARTGSDKINGQISTCVLGTTGYLAPEWVVYYLSCISFSTIPLPYMHISMHMCRLGPNILFYKQGLSLCYVFVFNEWLSYHMVSGLFGIPLLFFSELFPYSFQFFNALT